MSVIYDPYDWQIQEDPYPTYRALRDEAPLYRNDVRDFWALSRYDDVLAAFRDAERFSNTQGVSLERLGGTATNVMSILGMDPPRHTKHRALVGRAFTPRRVRDLEPSIRALTIGYLDPLAERGDCDYIRDLAGKVPMDVISEMVGVPKEDRDLLRGWADLVIEREEGNPNVPQAGLDASAKLLGYFADHVAHERKQPRDDITGALIAAEVDGERLEDTDVIAFLFLMIIAGNETTTKLLGNAMYNLWRHPGERAKVAADPSLVPRWVEETLRYDASSQLLARTTTCEVELHGETIPQDARVALLIGSANRDERRFADPDRYDVERDNTQSLAFGQGTHFCLGASLARLEGTVILEETLARIPGYEVDADGITRVHSSNVRGFAALPLTFGAGRR